MLLAKPLFRSCYKQGLFLSSTRSLSFGELDPVSEVDWIRLRQKEGLVRHFRNPARSRSAPVFPPSQPVPSTRHV